jgi:hypothetical protein
MTVAQLSRTLVVGAPRWRTKHRFYEHSEFGIAGRRHAIERTERRIDGARVRCGGRRELGDVISAPAAYGTTPMPWLVFRAIPQIVANLVRDAQLRSDRCKRGHCFGTGSGDQRAQRCGHGEQRSGLLRNDVEIPLLRGHRILRIELFELPEAAKLSPFAQCLDGACDDLCGDRSSYLAQYVEGRGDKQIADDERAIAAFRDMKCRDAAPLRRVVDDVVVHQRREMEELDRDCSRNQRRIGSAKWRPRGEDEGCAVQLGFADHGRELRAATVGRDVSKSLATSGELRSVADDRHGRNDRAHLLADSLSHDSTIAALCGRVKDAV